MTIPSRFTDTSMATNALGDLQRALARGQKIQSQISGGKLLTRPSDSPTGTVTSLQLRGEVRSTQQYGRNADDGLGWLGTIQDTLGDASTSVIRVRDLTLQGLSSSNNDQSRQALAVEIDNIRETLVGQANAKYMNRPVFGGTTPGGVAYEVDSTTGEYKYVGNDSPTTRTVGPNAKVRIETTGPEAFGTPGTDTELFAVLDTISKSLRSNGSGHS